MTSRRILVVSSLLALAACSSADKVATGSLTGSATYAGLSDSSGISITANGYSTTTDSAGNYSLGGLPVGAYTVVAVAPRSTERTLATSVTVPEGTVTAPALVFTAAQTLAGQLTVLGAPAAGATVTLDGGSTATTDANGIYSFPSAAGGKHTLAFSATGAASDRLDNVFYAPEIGGLTTDAYGQDALYRLDPFDLQGATRVTSLNLVNPGRSIGTAPFLSADGAFYAYTISNDLGTLQSVFVGSTAGGAPVLVAQDHWPTIAPRFSPSSRFLTLNRRNAATGVVDLWVAELGPGPTVVKTEKIVEGISSYEFSPQTTGASGATIYVLYTDAAAFNGRSLSERTLGGAAGAGSVVGNNTWQGVTSFQLSTKQGRIIFRWDGLASTPTPRLASASATGAAVTPQIVEQPGVDFSWAFHAFSPSESHWAYSIYNQVAGGTAVLGFKVVPTGNVSKVTISTTDAAVGTIPSCVSFDGTLTTASTRVVWTGNAAARHATRKIDIVADPAEHTLVAFSPSFSCPVLTSDGRVWMSYNDGITFKISLALADLPNTVSDVETGADFGTISFAAFGSMAVFTRVASPTVDFYVRPPGAAASTRIDTANDTGSLQFVPRGGGAVLYTKRELGSAQTAPNSLYWVGTSGATPTAPLRVVQRFTSLAVDPNQTFGLVRYLEEAGNFTTTASVGLATGATKALLRRSSTNALQDVGTPAAAKAILLRTGSAAPYRQQDGVYVADP